MENPFLLSELSHFVITRTQDMKDPTLRTSFCAEDMRICERLLSAQLSNLSQYPLSEVERSLSLVADCLRCLRNACASSPPNQQQIVSTHPALLSPAIDIAVIIGFLRENSSKDIGFQHIKPDSLDDALIICIQFLANFITANQEGVDLFWRLLTQHGNDGEQLVHLLCKVCGGEGDGGSLSLLHCSSAFLYNLMLFPESMERILSYSGTSALHTCIEVMVDLYLTHGIEWGFLIVSHIMSKAMYLHKSFQILHVHARYSMLKIVCGHLPDDHHHDSTTITPSRECLQVLAACFVDKVHTDLTLFVQQDQQNQDYAFHYQLLLTLCTLTSKPQFCSILQDNIDLMEGVIKLLSCLHRTQQHDVSVGPSKEEMCEMLNKLSIASSPGGRDASRDDSGVETDGSVRQLLVRVVANLVFRHRDNQDMVRRREMLPIILSSCNLSARDPFLRQWCVFAIRNLCEDNHTNQQYIGVLQPQSQVSVRLMSFDGDVTSQHHSDVPPSQHHSDVPPSQHHNSGGAAGYERDMWYESPATDFANTVERLSLGPDVRASNERDIHDLFN